MNQPIPKFYGEANNGVMNIFNLSDWKRYLLTLEGSKCEIVVKKFRRKRSNPQNRYYWGTVIKILADHFGYTQDEMHEAIKIEFLAISNDGKPDTVRSTKTLKTNEFNELIEQIKIWAATKFGVFIPDAEKVSMGD